MVADIWLLFLLSIPAVLLSAWGLGLNIKLKPALVTEAKQPSDQGSSCKYIYS